MFCYKVAGRISTDPSTGIDCHKNLKEPPFFNEQFPQILWNLGSQHQQTTVEEHVSVPTRQDIGVAKDRGADNESSTCKLILGVLLRDVLVLFVMVFT